MENFEDADEEENENFSGRSEIEANQLEELRSLLTEIFPANRFYTRKLNELGITFDVASLDDFSRRFPFTTKAELVRDQETRPPYGTNLTYPPGRYTRYHQTSGTTARPLRWLDTDESWAGMVRSWAEIFRAAGVGRGDRVYFAFSFGPFIGFWLAFESAQRLGCLCIPGGGLSSAARLQAMLENGATVLCCTPTYALRLAEVAAQERLDLSHVNVRKLIVAGEPGGSVPSIRARITRAWGGAEVFDHHGMTETGPVTYQCPAQPGVLHVIESAYYAEIIEPGTGKPVASGQEGELVLTTLGRVGMPLLRYRTGDVVKTPNSELETPNSRARCTCGRYAMAMEGGIIGRTDDMVVIRGVNVYPSAVDEIVQGNGEVAEYRVEVNRTKTLPELRVTIEASNACEDESRLVGKVQKAFAEALSLNVPVSVAARGTLPRFEMKARRWVVT